MGHNQILIAMELMDGDLEDLYKKVHKTTLKTFPSNLLGCIVVSIIDALIACQHNKIRHRDVKPKNILFKKDDGQIKLADFSIARLVERSSASTEIVTAGYMAPEYYDENIKRIDSRAEVWSVGITLLECIKGSKILIDSDGNVPESHRAMNACLKSFDPLKEVDEYGQQYSDDFRTFIKACLRKDRTHRPKYPELKQYAFYETNKPGLKNEATFKGKVIKELIEIMDNSNV